MNGLQTLFTLLDPPTVGTNNATVRVRIDAGHRLFSGHFPDRPVFLGVVMAHIATLIISGMTGTPMRIVTARAIKFLSPVDPHLTPELTFTAELRPGDNDTGVEVRATAGETTVMKLTASVIRDER